MCCYILEDEKGKYFKNLFDTIETTEFIEVARKFFSALEAKMFKEYYLKDLECFKIKKITVF